ncbi:MAG TPA: glycerol-3-phosphate dehydrogenase [Bacteroidetes bacterium]|nr:glycerol-3-phosphate dehydrogenase [Bacteroidota bacterium]
MRGNVAIPDQKKYNVIIIGGGINGAGIALDAALRGLSVLLLEKSDFGSATTSASTKLIHGGLRYLEYFELPLVRESLHERERLLKNAPHLVKPLRLKLPIYKHSARGSLVIKAGMIFYDLLSLGKSLPNHKMIWRVSRGKMEKSEPGLLQDQLKSIAIYYDCQVNYPERLCLEVVLSAREAGALTLNYCEVFAIGEMPEATRSVQFRDVSSGKKYQVFGEIIVNAGGPYVDKICGLLDPNIEQRIHGAKGSHLIFGKFENGPHHALYVEAIQDGRPFFIIPWRDYYLVGTTDIYFDGSLDRVSVSKEEIDYLLYEINHFFPDADITVNDILYSYSGVRPLPYEPDKKEAQVTRKHIIFDHGKHNGHRNFISIIGGKLTTYRNLAEECVDLICEKLNISDAKSETKAFPLFGSYGIGDMEKYRTEMAATYAESFHISPTLVDHLVQFYGARFKLVLDLTKDDADLKAQICEYNLDIKAQIVYAIKYEEAKTLADIIIRRTSIGTSACLGLNCAGVVADISASFFRWDEIRKKEEVEKFKERMIQLHLPDPLISQFVEE